MARGEKAPNGATRIAQNGYHYTKVDDKWRLTHHLIAEKKYGRPIREDERVIFLNGKRSDLSPENIGLREKGKVSLRRRKAQLEARIEELQAQLRDLELQIKDE